jgi:hypothetical protein
MDRTPCEFDVEGLKNWVKDSGVWRVKETTYNAAGMIQIRCICAFGGSARAYERQLSLGSKIDNAGSRTRGFAKPAENFCNCDAELRVYCVLGRMIDRVMIRTREGGRTHTHGEFVGGPVSASLAKLDASLETHNAVTRVSRSQPLLRPVSVVATASDDILDRLPDGTRVIAELNMRLRAVQAICARTRGFSGPMSVSELNEMRTRIHEEFYVLRLNDPDRSDHFPRIVGVSYIEGDFGVTISTTHMLRRAVNCPTGVIAVDCTFKTNVCDYPLLVTTTEDRDHTFYPVSFTLVHGEDAAAYEIGLKHLKAAIDGMLVAEGDVTADWAPRYLMGDGAHAITNGCQRAFPPSDIRPEAPTRLTCFFHVMQALRKHNSEWSLNKDQKKELRSQVQTLAAARSPAQFAAWVVHLVAHWEGVGKQALTRYLRRSGGFFDPQSPMSNWHWIPVSSSEKLDVAWISQANSGLESLNGRIKSLIFGRFLHGFRASIAALLGRGMRNFSISGSSVDFPEGNDYSRYTMHRKFNRMLPSTATRVSEGHFLCAKATEGSTYVFHNLDDNPVQFLEESYNPFVNGSRTITFIPDEASRINAMPNRGGPICTCIEYRKTNKCLHIAILLQREKGFALDAIIGNRIHGQRELRIVSNGECLRRLPRKRKNGSGSNALVIHRPTTRSQSSRCG